MGQVIVRAVLVSSLLSLAAAAGHHHEFAYTGEHGPNHWKDTFPQCGGKRQSPIAINSRLARYDSTLDSSIFMESLPVAQANFSVKNNGHTVVVDVSPLKATFSGLGLPEMWNIMQFHAHWGDKDNAGSEHTLNTQKFPLEVHIVMKNSKYGSMNESLFYADGLAVLGVFFKLGKANDVLQPMIDAIPEITHEGDTALIPAFRIAAILPANRQVYYRYSGSLTTPNCNEVVTWTVFDSAVEISSEQLKVFRTLVTEDGEHLVNNYRPTQPLSGRIVRKSAAPSALKASDLVAAISVLLLAVMRFY